MITVQLENGSYTVKKLLGKGDSNAKLKKSDKAKVGYRTFGLSLAAHRQSGYNVCPLASAGCSLGCLMSAGRGAMSNVANARIAKTKAFFANLPKFKEMIRKELSNALKVAKRKGYKLAVRLNVLSDIQWEKVFPELFSEFPEIQFYDYTKIPNRKVPKNYHLTFSRSEVNESVVVDQLEQGRNVAVVFETSNLPAQWNGFKVVNGDETDLRFLDEKNVVVGLYAKGKAKKDTTGFVVKTS